MSSPVEPLVEQAKAGSPAAASELVVQNYERIYAYLRRLCQHDEEAADLTQKTFIRLWAALPAFAGKSSFSTWLHGIAYHVYLDWRRQEHPAAPQSEEWWSLQAGPESSPFDNVAQRETAQQLYLLVENLDETARQTVHLHYYQGLSITETAEVLGVATSTVKYRLREALAFLRSQTAEPKSSLCQTPNRIR